MQAERTALSWTRTSLGFLANGALLLIPGWYADRGLSGWIAAGLAAALALSTCVIGVARQRKLARRPLPERISPRREVYLVAASIVLLTVISIVSLMV